MWGGRCPLIVAKRLRRWRSPVTAIKDRARGPKKKELLGPRDQWQHDSAKPQGPTTRRAGRGTFSQARRATLAVRPELMSSLHRAASADAFVRESPRLRSL